jgi:ATP-dependent Lon protease
MFIATANTSDTISAPLLDRCEVIECSGYVLDEKLKIAQRFLLPKQIRENGLEEAKVVIEEDVLAKVVSEYTHEAGVRSLEREISKLCRTKAVEFSASREKGATTAYKSLITIEDMEKILGMAKYEQEVKEEAHRPGVVTSVRFDSCLTAS